METIDDMFYAFGKNFVFASVMFLPDSLMELLKEEHREGFSEIMNTLYVFESGGDNYPLDEQQTLSSLYVFPKKALLDDNLFKLLGLKEAHSGARFEFILNKYMEQLGGYTYFSRWLFENAESYIENISSDAKSAFELQYDSFLDHTREVGEQFPLSVGGKSEMDMETIGRDTAQQLGSILGEGKLNNVVKDMGKQSENLENPKQRMKRLREEIRSMADGLVLESIFNIKKPMNPIQSHKKPTA